MSAALSHPRDTLVPLADRVHYLLVFRLLAVVAAIVSWVALQGERSLPLPALLLAAAGYLGLSTLSNHLWRASGQRNLTLLGAMLLVDGVYLAVVAYAGGGVTSPLRYAVLLHLLVVSLLASYRTGMKLALWHSMLFFLASNPESAHVLHVGAGVLRGSAATEDVAAFAVAIWAVTLTTCTFSAVNERELRRRAFDLSALASLAQRLEQVSDAAAVGDALVSHVARDLDFRRVLLLRLDGDAPALLARSRGVPDGQQTELSVPVAPAGTGLDLLLRRAASQHGAVLTRRLDGRGDPWLTMLLPGAANLVAVGLHVDGQAAGVLVCELGCKTQDRVQRRLVSMVERFAAHGAMALGKARLVEALDRLARTDGLTGLATRRSFDAALSAEVERSIRCGQPVSLALLDIDHFKRINDEHGHPVGDRVLQAVAGVLRQEVGDVGHVARYGGEEFAVLLPGHDVVAAADLADRVRRAIRTAVSRPQTTVSVGVAGVPADAAGTRELVYAADQALYAAKRGGRDRVVSAGADAGAPVLPSPSPAADGK